MGEGGGGDGESKSRNILKAYAWFLYTCNCPAYDCIALKCPS